MKRFILSVLAFSWSLVQAQSVPSQPATFNATMDDIVLDIYNSVAELGETDYEQLQSDLYALHDAPIDLNATSEEELRQLCFLSPQQIDDILRYAEEHGFDALYELKLIPSLDEYTLRNLLPFIQLSNPQSPISNLQSPISNIKSPISNLQYQISPREVFSNASHELVTRLDARNIEGFEGTDPVFVQTRYRFDYNRRVIFGAQLRRPPGGDARSLQYGAYLQLRDIGHLHSLVAGNFQASFGQGLVLAPVFHSGKSAYVTSVGMPQEGLRYYSSVDGEGLHGAGATLRWEWDRQTRLDVSALYSMRRTNDSVWHHLIGANLTFRYRRFSVQLTAIENIWTDSIHPYRDAAYNAHYFRGRNQAVLGAAARYNHGVFDLFGEVATAQNFQSPVSTVQSPTSNPHWGFGLIVGSRFYPAEGVTLLALYRYYSPYFDNALGYAFSETGRIGDENGGYIGLDITRWHRWRVKAYVDLFYFSGPKYGIPDSPSFGFDLLAEAQYRNALTLRARARRKGDTDTYSLRAQYSWSDTRWSLRSSAEANLTNQISNLQSPISNIQSPSSNLQSPISNLQSQISYGVTIYQDLAYSFSSVPLALRARVQYFNAREWANRIYTYEHDVLYGFSIPAVYGHGLRAYFCLQWRILPILSLFFRASETIYFPDWLSTQSSTSSASSASSASARLATSSYARFSASSSARPTRTDFHLLLRLKL